MNSDASVVRPKEVEIREITPCDIGLCLLFSTYMVSKKATAILSLTKEFSEDGD